LVTYKNLSRILKKHKKSLGLTIVYPTQKTSQKEDYVNGKIIEINEEKSKIIWEISS